MTLMSQDASTADPRAAWSRRHMLKSHGPLDWLQSAPAGLALCPTSGPPTPLGTSEFAEKPLGLWQANVQVLLPASHLAGEKWSFSPAVSEEY